MTKTKAKRIISLFVAVVMMLALLPAVPVFAKELKTYTYNFNCGALGLTEQISHSNQITATIGSDGTYGNYYSSDGAYTDSNKWVYVGRRGNYGGFTRPAMMDTTLGSAGVLPSTTNNGCVIKINVPESGTYSPVISYNKVALGCIVDFYIVDTDTEGFAASYIAYRADANPNISTVIGTLKTSGDEYHIGSVDTYTNSTDSNPATMKTVTLEAGDYWLICEMSGLNSALTAAAKYTVQLKSLVLNEVSAEMSLDISDDLIDKGLAE